MRTSARGLGPMMVLLAASPCLAGSAVAPPLPPPRPAAPAAPVPPRAPERSISDTGPVPAGSVAPLPPPRPAAEQPPGLPSPLAPLRPPPGPEPIPAQPLAEVPLPPPRPTDLRPAPESSPAPGVPPPWRAADQPPQPATASPAPFPGLVPLEDAYACLRLFRDGRVEAHLLPAIAPAGPGCGIASPADVAAIVLDPGGGRVRVEPPITVGCAMGNATAAWVREDLAPAFAASGSPLAALTGTSGYACRGRNGVAGARPSEHGLGHAVDIGGFARADRTTIEVRQTDAPMLAQVRATACARFATVLGPGSDGFHEAHMHVDIEERRNHFAICHWDRL